MWVVSSAFLLWVDASPLIIIQQLEEAAKKNEELSKEQESLIDIFSEERQRRDIEEEKLRKSLKVCNFLF